jgi:hypothetical protein
LSSARGAQGSKDVRQADSVRPNPDMTMAVWVGS